MKLRDLFVSIGFDVDDKALKELDKGLAKTKGLILAVGATATASAGFLLGLAKSVADTGDKAAKTADKLGVQIEALQELRYAAELSGIAQNNFDTALQRMTRRAAEAAKGTGEAKVALRQLGVQLTDGHGRMRRSEDMLADIADGMARVEDPSRRVALAFKLFDTEGVGMVNMLGKGGDYLRSMRQEARSLGFVLSEQAARDAEVFQDELLRSKSVITGIKNTVGADLLPVFIELMKQFRQWVMYNREIIKSRLDRLIKGLIALVGGLYQAGRRVVMVLGDIVELFGGIERVATTAAWAIGLFAGAQVLTAVGSLALGIVKLTKTIRMMGNSALIANAKALATPLLIGAAIAAVILIIQDLYKYVKGEKSLYGYIIDSLLKDHPRLQKILRFTLGDTIGLIKKTIGDAVDWIKEKIAPILKPLSIVKEWMGSVGGKVSGAWEATQSAIGNSPMLYPAHTTGSYGNQNNVRVDAPITVNVSPDTPPEMVAREVRQGVSEGIGRMLRDTALATECKVSH